MPKGTRICRICGKEYEYCRTALPKGNRFRWQDVACCAEHGAAYFAKIMESRGTAPKADPVIEPEEFDELFEEEFDDSDEDIDIEK